MTTSAIHIRTTCSAITLLFALSATLVLAVASKAACPSVDLAPPMDEEGDQFGRCVALSGDGSTIVVGDPEAGDSGAAYVFVQRDSDWVIDTTLKPLGDPNSYFGGALTISPDGTRLLIGAPDYSWPATSTGSAYFYMREGDAWRLVQQIVASDSAIGDRFGAGVAMSADGTVAMLGAPGAMAAYALVCRGDQWIEQAKIVPPYFLAASNFGHTIALDADGSTALFGAKSWDPIGLFLHYERNGAEWQIQGTFDVVAPDSESQQVVLTAAGDRCIAVHGDQAVALDLIEGHWMQFGDLTVLAEGHCRSAAITSDGRRALVGNPMGWLSIYENGVAYLIDLAGTTPRLAGVLTRPAPYPIEDFGSFVALSAGGETAVAARLDSVYWSSGRAYVFPLNPWPSAGDGDFDGVLDVCDNCLISPNPDQSDCDQDGVGDLCALVANRAADCDLDVLPDECELETTGVLTYQIDSGVYDGAVGFSGSTDVVWMNQFTVEAGADHVVAVDTVWAENIPVGTPMTLAVWDDPNNDGDPADAFLLQTTQTIVEDVPFGSFVTIPMPPTYVGRAGDSFFVGAYSVGELLGDENFPMSFQEAWPSYLRSWFSFGSSPADVRGPPGGEIYPVALTGYPGNWLIRARTAVVPDCDGDGVLDDCQIVDGAGTDLDRDGVLDACQDCDGDGTPNSLEISRGDEQDCDRNHVPDSCDLAQGSAEDCNGDAVPDQCQVAKWYSIGSGLMSPIGFDSPQEFTMVTPPPPAGDVTVTVKAAGDFGFTSEYLTVRVNGIAVGTVFQETGVDCQWPLVESFMVPRAIWLAAAGAGDVVITIDPSPGVDSSLCELPSAALVVFAYLGAGSADADSDGVVDGCPGGANPADLNHDGTVDAFDLGMLLSQWGPCAVPGVHCVADFNRDGVVNGLDLAILLAAWE